MKNSNSYFKGIAGALIFCFIAAIPWMIVYIFGNIIFSLLALLIALGALYGYKKFRGPNDKKMFLVIVFVPLFVVTISTLFIVPGILLIRDGLSFNFENISLLYKSGQFVSSIIKDLIISLIFTVIGIVGIILNIKQEDYSKSKNNTKKNSRKK